MLHVGLLDLPGQGSWQGRLVHGPGRRPHKAHCALDHSEPGQHEPGRLCVSLKPGHQCGMRANRALSSTLRSEAQTESCKSGFRDRKSRSWAPSEGQAFAGEVIWRRARKLWELTGRQVAAITVACALVFNTAWPVGKGRAKREIDRVLARPCDSHAKGHGRSRKQATLRPTYSPVTALAVQGSAGRTGRVDAGRTQTLLTQSALATCWGSWRQRWLGVCRLIDAWGGWWHCAPTPSSPCGASGPCGWCPQYGLWRVHFSLLTKARRLAAMQRLKHVRDDQTDNFHASRDAEQADIDKEKAEQAKGPAAQAHELEELAQIYEERGLSPGLARQVRHAAAQS